MKPSIKIAFCAISAALASVFMLASYFPYLTYAIPGISGLFMILPLIEIDIKHAFFSYIVSAVLIIIFAEPESAVLYLCLLGYYPVLKSLIEKIKKPAVCWIMKIAVLNIAVVAVYLILSYVIGISVDDFGELGRYGSYIFIALCNVVFVIYDIAVSRMAVLYLYRIHPQVRKLIK